MSASEDVTLFPGRKKSKSKVQVIRDFATAFAKAEEDRAAYLYEAYFAPDGVFHENSLAQEEFPGTLQALESLAEEPGDELAEGNEMFILRKAWEGAQGDPLYAEMCADVPEERRYISWVSGLAPESIPLPEGWPGWEPCIPVGDQPAMALKSVRAKKLPDDPEAVKALSEKKTKVPKKTTPESIRAAFDLKMAALDPTTLYKPWMATKSLRLVTSMEEFQAWADRVFTDKSLWRPCPVTGELMPVVAVDTETFGLEEGHSGLDTRLIHGKPQIDTAGVCLCADGYEALYIPINAIDGNVIDRVAATALLQEICDRCLLVFFNAKFDREVLRITMGIKFRRYPYFEDVQVLHFLKDPKSDVDEEVSNARSEGLKSLSSRFLGIDQIELDDLAKVKVKVTKADGSKGVRTLMAPFHWIPTSMAYLYAAPDALTTWLLWDQMHEECRKMPYVHKIDHHLVDALAWIERQRPKIDIETLKKTCGWHQEKLDNLSKQLSDIAGETFNPKSADQLSRILFSKLNFKVVKRSAKTGKPSTDEEVLEALKKAHPHHSFLETLERFKGYASLHPNHLHFDPRDLTARLHFKQCTVAGGRLAAMGGEFEKDGGFGMNPQAIKAVGDNKWIPARRLRLEDTEDLGEKFDPAQVPPIDIEQVNDACREVDKKTGARGALSIHGVIGNHVVRYCGEWWSIAKDETSITLENGQTILLDPTSQVDAEEVVNLRKLFVADPGYSYFVIDYSNVEMRVAANNSLEPLFIEEFLHGSGDFHTLTAKSVFPEFCELQDEVKRLQVSDPLNKDSGIQSRIKEAKAKMKKLRSLAKIINFALLYGGTEYSIFQNMQLEDPTITKEKAKAMVDAYWESVPKFKEWAETQQIRAKTTMTCVTRSGRKINFKSAMETLGIYVPAKEHYQNNRTYWNLMRRADDLKAAKKDEEAQVVLAKAQEMMLDKNTGVRNVGDYNKFVGKTLRVSVNAPLQGLAGDFMRAALVAIYLWSQDAGLGDVFRLHATVHDEIDFSVKNEYVPYILPRIDRLMKHRKMHERMKWPVPLETDCEYGSTWDVKEHLTGDDTHTPAGYTKIPGLESYIPQMFDDDTVHGLFDALVAGDRQSVVEYLKGAVHPRCHGNIPRIANTTTSLEDADRTLTAILQLHEYWTIDEADPDDPEDETLGEYQERMGLEPLDTWIPVEVMPVNVTVAAAPSQVEETPQEEEATSIQEDAAPEEPPAPVEPSPQLKMVPRLVKGYPQLRDLTEEEWALLQAKLGLGHSTALAAAPDGESLMRFSRVSTEQIPEDFLVLEVEGSVCG